MSPPPRRPCLRAPEMARDEWGQTHLLLRPLHMHTCVLSLAVFFFFKGTVGPLATGIHMICSAAISPFSPVIGSADII